jgi:hypothetical protein
MAFVFLGCEEYRQIPAGYVGKILTPTGWEKGVREAGMVDIGTGNPNGTKNVLVILEATSVAIKEHFGKDGGNGEDDRVIINKTPCTVDFYVRCAVAADLDTRNAVFAQMTPKSTSMDRVSVITIDAIYTQFAKMDIRSGVRSVLSKYPDYNSVVVDMDGASTKGSAMAIESFKASGVPLLMQNAKFSNIKQDETVWAAENAKQASLAQVATIDSLGKALRRNPEYMLFKKYDTYKDIAAKNTGVSFTIIDGQPGGVVIGK